MPFARRTWAASVWTALGSVLRRGDERSVRRSRHGRSSAHRRVLLGSSQAERIVHRSCVPTIVPAPGWVHSPVRSPGSTRVPRRTADERSKKVGRFVGGGRRSATRGSTASHLGGYQSLPCRPMLSEPLAPTRSGLLLVINSAPETYQIRDHTQAHLRDTSRRTARPSLGAHGSIRSKQEPEGAGEKIVGLPGRIRNHVFVVAADGDIDLDAVVENEVPVAGFRMSRQTAKVLSEARLPSDRLRTHKPTH